MGSRLVRVVLQSYNWTNFIDYSTLNLPNFIKALHGSGIQNG